MKPSLSYPFRRILWLYGAWWIFWAFVQADLLRYLGLTWHMALVDAFVSNMLLALAGFIIITIYRFYQPGRNNLIYLVIFGVGITKLFSVVLTWVLRHLFPHDESYFNFLELSTPIRFVFSLLIISFITAISWMWGYMKDREALDKRRADADQLAKDAELAKLRQQLQPHFLFNSLNSISALAGSRPNEARKMIQQLSDFLRGTLKKDEQQMVRLEEELQHLGLYLDIEKVRFGHRLSIETERDEKSLEAKLPPLILQPIVENAIKFGLYDTTGETTISIRAYMAASFLHIEVRNPYDAQTRHASKGTGFGLSSVQRRLYLLFARQDLLTTEQQDNIYVTKLKIPQAG